MRRVGGLTGLGLFVLAWAACGGDDTESFPPTTTVGGAGGATTTTTQAGGEAGSSATGGTGGAGGTAGAGGGLGGQGGSGGSVPVSDACPGTTLSLALDEALEFDGSTVGATGDYSSWCGNGGSGSGPDVVYELTLEAAGTFELELTNADGETFDAAVYLQGTCGDDDSNLGCIDGHETSERYRLHYEAGTYYVIVDGNDGGSGDFTLRLSLATPDCGDGVLNPGEICDDGNDAANDGCFDCEFETPPSEPDVCPGPTAVSLTTAGLHVESYTTGFTDNYVGGCTSGTGGLDRVMSVVPQASGTMTVAIGFEADGTTPCCEADPTGIWCWDHVLYVRTACDSASDEVDCSDVDGDVPEVVAVTVTAGQTYWVIVDGYDSEFYSWGPYHLFFTLQ